MENTLDNQFHNDLSAAPARPQFLTVLCILTWVMCGIWLLISLFGIVGQLTGSSKEAQAQRIEQLKQFNPEAAAQIEATTAEQSGGSQILSNMIIMLVTLISAFGARNMWKLKKNGFYLYILGELGFYLSILITGKQSLSLMSSLGGSAQAALGLGLAIFLIIDLVFIILYGLNLKHMNK
jgi:hypothetical protein